MRPDYTICGTSEVCPAAASFRSCERQRVMGHIAVPGE